MLYFSKKNATGPNVRFVQNQIISLCLRLGKLLILDKTRVKLFSNFTRHCLISYILMVITVSKWNADCRYTVDTGSTGNEL